MVGKYDFIKAGMYTTKRSSTSRSIWVLSIILIACIIGFIAVAKMVDDKALRKKWYIGLGLTLSVSAISLLIAVIIRMYTAWLNPLSEIAEAALGEDNYSAVEDYVNDGYAGAMAVAMDAESGNVAGLANTFQHAARDWAGHARRGYQAFSP